jgi:hypothetical protein
MKVGVILSVAQLECNPTQRLPFPLLFKVWNLRLRMELIHEILPLFLRFLLGRQFDFLLVDLARKHAFVERVAQVVLHLSLVSGFHRGGGGQCVGASICGVRFFDLLSVCTILRVCVCVCVCV